MPSVFVSPTTTAALFVGVLIAYFYVHHMWKALQRAVRTRNLSEEGGVDRFRGSLIGAAAACGLSAAAIAAYGAGPGLLYLGPGLLLASPIAVAYCLYKEHTS